MLPASRPDLAVELRDVCGMHASFEAGPIVAA
jgi:hypothetical protein